MTPPDPAAREAAIHSIALQMLKAYCCLAIPEFREVVWRDLKLEQQAGWFAAATIAHDAAEKRAEEMCWRPMKDAPTGTPIVLRQRDWVCTGIILPEPVDDYDLSRSSGTTTIVHYNGDVLMDGFHGVWDGWMPRPVTRPGDAP